LRQNTDTLARIIAIAGLAIALAKLAFDIAREFIRGRRVKVTLREQEVDGTSHLLVTAFNPGTIGVSLDSWGFRLASGLRRPKQLVPHTTGPGGPDTLPGRLEGGDTLQFSFPRATIVDRARTAFPSGTTSVKVRGFVVLPDGKRKWSSRLVTRLQ
jgi:hypothetical protein